MKKIVLILLLLTSIFAVGQNNSGKKFNFEIGLGYSLAAQKHEAEKLKYKLGFYFEERYNSPGIPVNIGLQIGYSTFTRVIGGDDKFRSFSILPVADYNFRKGGKINPYAGIGMGIAFNNIDGVFNAGFKSNFCIMPRIGVRFINHLNLSLDYQISHTDYSHMNIRFGFYF